MVEKNWTDTCKKIKLDHPCISHTKINSKWIKDLNVRLETIKILKENIESKLFNITLSYIFSYVSLNKGNKKGKNNQMRLYHTKRMLTVKKTISKMKQQPIK